MPQFAFVAVHSDSKPWLVKCWNRSDGVSRMSQRPEAAVSFLRAPEGLAHSRYTRILLIAMRSGYVVIPTAWNFRWIQTTFSIAEPARASDCYLRCRKG